MKKHLAILATLFFTITGLAQQIGDGYAPMINDFGGLLKSGVFGGVNHTGGVPDLSYGGHQHLFVIRHANSINNHQLQIASSFAENDRLFFRKIVSSDLTPLNPTWIEIATRGANTFNGSQSINGDLIVSNSSPKSALEVLEVSDSKPQGQTVPTKSVLKLSRSGTLNYSYPENAEFRIGHGGGSVYGSKLDLYINGGSNTNSIPDQHVMTWNYNGNVGIGIINPNNKLDVNGTIHSKEVKVDMIGWSDFVLKKNIICQHLQKLKII
ncbi:hypothetical protein [Flavobacterium sp. N1736]|uniref:hypothetical protein n=1 Tax=Flavobacterium sp. N1736 TaxID=2986823 RepID=UPI002224F10D|nr:hypothetical protein [Flavobacterium sp. N1736]